MVSKIRSDGGRGKEESHEWIQVKERSSGYSKESSERTEECEAR